MTDASVSETAPAAATVAPAASVSAPVSAPSLAAIEATPQVAPSSSEAAVAAEAVVSPAAEVSAAAALEVPAITEEPVATEDTDILSGEGEVKAEESVVKEPAAEDKPAETVKTDTPTELPKFEDFTVPEGITLPDDVKGEFTKLLGEMETGKLDHEGIQAQGQKFIDLGTKLVTESLERMKDHFVELHNQQKATWLQEFKADKELGGARTNTTINTVRDAVENYGGTPEQVKALRGTFKQTGVTNNPDTIRLIANMANTIKRYETEQEVGAQDTRIVAGARPAPVKTKSYQGFYTKQ